MYIPDGVSISVSSPPPSQVPPASSMLFRSPYVAIYIARAQPLGIKMTGIYSRCALPRPFFLRPRHKCRAALSHSSRYICLLVLNRPVITALKGRYSGRWLRTFYSATSRSRYLPLRSVALIARWREIAGFERLASGRWTMMRTHAKNVHYARTTRTTRSAWKAWSLFFSSRACVSRFFRAS